MSLDDRYWTYREFKYKNEETRKPEYEANCRLIISIIAEDKSRSLTTREEKEPSYQQQLMRYFVEVNEIEYKRDTIDSSDDIEVIIDFEIIRDDLVEQE